MTRVTTIKQEGWLDSINILDLMVELPGHFYILNQDGRVVFLDTNMLKSLGVDDSKQVHDQVASGWVGQDDVDYIALVRETGQAHEFLAKVVVGSSKQSYWSHMAPLFDVKTRKVVGALGISIRIDDEIKTRKKLKRTIKKLDLVKQGQGQFIAGLSHDLRTPLSELMGMIELMLVKSLDPMVQHYGHMAQQAAEGLMAYFEQIIEIERNKRFQSDQSLFSQIVDLKEFCHDVCRVYVPSIEFKGLSLSVNVSMSDLIWVIPDALSTVLMNLIGNAVKYTSSGQIDVVAQVKTYRNQKMVSLQIRDTGPGISNTLRRKIFEPFYRVEQNDMPHGAGLGLAIAKKHAKRMQGHLRLLPSVPGEGATFELMFPYRQGHCAGEGVKFQDSPMLAYPFDHQVIPEKKGASGFVMAIIEDGLLAARAIIDWISHHYPGLTIRHYISGQSFLDDVKRGLDPDLICLDIELGDVRGDQVALIIKERGLLQKRRALIAVTGHTQLSFDPKLFDAVWIKPIGQSQWGLLFEQYFTPKELAMLHDDRKTSGYVSELDALLLESLKTSLPEIEKAFVRNQLKLLQDELHRLKGGLAYCDQPLLLGIASLYYQESLLDQSDLLPFCHDHFVDEVREAIGRLEAD